MIAFYTALITGTTALAIMVVQTGLDIRGANRFVRPFHYGGAFITVLLAALIAELVRRWLPRLQLDAPWRAASCYLMAFLVVWWFIIPADDAVAQIVERRMRTPQEVGDTGYGWFYYDDSGMGADPMHLLIVLIYCVFRAPWWLAALIVFIYSIHIAALPNKRIHANVA